MVMVEVSMSKQMGQVNSDWRDLGETAISVVSVIASCGVLMQRFYCRENEYPSQDFTQIRLQNYLCSS